jgi:uncharacterized membrane protein YbhN (UPF0104 family)
MVIGGVLFLILNALRHYSGEVKSHVAHINLRVLLAGYALCVLYRVLNSAGWGMILRAMRQRMPLLRGMRLWLTAESMRWLPGSIWSFASRVYQASRNGVPPVVASASLPLELLLTVVAWTLVAGGGIFVSGRSVDWRALLTPRVIAFCAGGILVGVAVLLISLRALPQSRIRGKFKKLISEFQALRTIRLRWTVLAGVLVFYTALCCLNGIAFYVVLRSVSDSAVDPIAVIGINACGWLLGFLAIGAPGGIGVREAGSAMLLSAVMPLSSAIAGSVLWRVVMILDELTCLSVCLAPTLAANPGRPPVTPARAPIRAEDNPHEAGQK